MSPEDCYRLVSRIVERFPGLVTDCCVNGSDLAEWISGEVRRDPLLQQIAKGHVVPDDPDFDHLEPPVCPECEETDFIENLLGSDDLRCIYCQTIWKKQDIV